jgi:transcription antitermination protein NusB
VNNKIESRPRHVAREFSVQFLYQCESEKIHHFPEAQFVDFCSHHDLDAKVSKAMRSLVKGTFDNIASIDEKITSISNNWSIDRMAATDRNVLRLATYEILESNVSNDVVLNEAVELAKKFGTNESGRFVNGILDKIAKG